LGRSYFKNSAQTLAKNITAVIFEMDSFFRRAKYSLHCGGTSDEFLGQQTRACCGYRLISTVKVSRPLLFGPNAERPTMKASEALALSSQLRSNFALPP
jgi:hypothetical protein